MDVHQWLVPSENGTNTTTTLSSSSSNRSRIRSPFSSASQKQATKYLTWVDSGPGGLLQPQYGPVPLDYRIEYILPPSLFVDFIDRQPRCSYLIRDLDRWRPNVPKRLPTRLGRSNQSATLNSSPLLNISLAFEGSVPFAPPNETLWIRSLRGTFNEVSNNGIGADSRLLYFYARAMVIFASTS